MNKLIKIIILSLITLILLSVLFFGIQIKEYFVSQMSAVAIISTVFVLYLISKEDE